MIASSLREVVVIECPTTTRSETGEILQAFAPYEGAGGHTHRAAIEQVTASESAARGGVAVNAAYEVKMRPVYGLTNDMRLRWKNRGGIVLYISGIREEGVPVHSLVLTCERRER